ncbi:hypothetical protein AGMMS49942_18560 [Spirochaetia bacterium]|nr:hypothetical protein AGMMS49942_18560 [Spirochaetia bacterium]
MLVIIALVFLWCALVPVAGAVAVRRSWRRFRRRFDALCLQPVLDYAACQNTPPSGGSYRFTGGFESLTDGQTLWIRSDTLTIPIALKDAHIYMLPLPEGGEVDSFDPGEEAPERIRWDRMSTLTEGAKVFVGGLLLPLVERWTFVSTKKNPLLVIFYDGPDTALATRAIRAGRHRNEYWNPITPYGFILNAFAQISIAAAFLPRPAYRLTVITAVIALFAPLLPLLPPGVLLTVLYRQLWWRARIFRAYRDLARLPLKYLQTSFCGRLPNGEQYGGVWYEDFPTGGTEAIPLLIPEQRPRRTKGWYVFGALTDEGALPARPQDPFAAFGAMPGEPEILAKHYTRMAHILEIAGGLFLLIGMALNLLFIAMIIYLLQ